MHCITIDLIISNKLVCKYYYEKTAKEYNPYNLVYGGSEETPEVLHSLKDADAYLGIGDNRIRSSVFTHLHENGISMPFIAHPSSIISTKISIGEATAIMPGCMINSLTTIGRAVICNTGSIIEHECVLGDFVHVSPGAVLAGNVTVGAHSFIGANAVIRQGVTIGEHVIIGAGSVVLTDIKDNCTVYGNPAKPIVQ